MLSPRLSNVKYVALTHEVAQSLDLMRVIWCLVLGPPSWRGVETYAGKGLSTSGMTAVSRRWSIQG